MVKTRVTAGWPLICSTSAAESSTLSAVKGSADARGVAPFGDLLSAARAANSPGPSRDGPSDTPATYAPHVSSSPAPTAAIRFVFRLIYSPSFASRSRDGLPSCRCVRHPSQSRTHRGEYALSHAHFAFRKPSPVPSMGARPAASSRGAGQRAEGEARPPRAARPKDRHVVLVISSEGRRRPRPRDHLHESLRHPAIADRSHVRCHSPLDLPEGVPVDGDEQQRRDGPGHARRGPESADVFISLERQLIALVSDDHHERASAAPDGYAHVLIEPKSQQRQT